MADGQADILLKVSANLEGIKKAQEAFLDLQNAAKFSMGGINAAAKEAAGFGDTFREQFFGSFGMGAGLTAGATAAMSVVAAVRAISGAIKGVLSEGIQFTAEMENAKTGIAAALQEFDPERYHTFQQALEASGDVIDKLKAKSAQFGLSFPALAEQYTATVGAMFKGGITDLNKQIELSVTLNRAMTTLGIQGFRATRDIADILNGVANRTVAGRSLGITDADLKAASEAGQLYEFLNQKLHAFTEAVTASAENITILQERLNATTAQSASDATADLAVSYKELLKSLIALTSSDAFKQTVRFLSLGAQASIGQLTDLADVIDGRQPLTGPQQEAVAGRKQFDQFSAQADNVRSQSDIDSATDQGWKNIRQLASSGSAIGDDDNTSTGNIVELIDLTRQRLSLLQSEGQKQIELNKQKDLEAQMEARAAAFTREAAAARDALVKKGPEIQAQEEARVEAAFKEADKSEYINMLLAKKASLTAQLNGPDSRPERYLGSNEASDPSKQSEAQQAAYTFRLEMAGKIAQVEHEIFATQDAEAKAEEAENKKAQEAADKKEKQAEKELAAKRSAASQEQQRADQAAVDSIKEDEYLTDRQKKELLYLEYKREEQQIAEDIAIAKKRVETEPDGSATKAQAQDELKRLQERQQVTLPKEMSQTAPGSFFGDMTSGLVKLTNSFKSIGSEISGVMNSALNSVSSNITALIMKTKTWHQALASVASTITTQVVQAIVQASVQWVARKVIEFALGNSLRAAALAANAATAMGMSAIWAAPATLATIASWGGAAAMAPVAVGGAMAAVQGMALFKVGGYTGNGDSDEVAGLVHRREVVFNEQDVANHGGVAAVEALRVGKLVSVRSVAS
ncbi:MAG TPA: hypothetical protein VGG34_01250 [Opitutaceae bacterium]|jgi:hypothetical protein